MVATNSVRPPIHLRPSYGRVLENRGFSWIWVSQTVSQSGEFIFYVAIVWFVLSVTESVIDAGIITAAEAVPIVVASPLLGVYVDRLDLRKILLLGNLLPRPVTDSAPSRSLPGIPREGDRDDRRPLYLAPSKAVDH